jgi:hypothetical protein
VGLGDWIGALSDIGDLGYAWRYNKLRPQKEQEALKTPGLAEQVPYDPARYQDIQDYQDDVQRYGAGYAFGKKFSDVPWLARAAQAGADLFHPGDERQALARTGLERALAERAQAGPPGTPTTVAEGLAEMVGWRGDMPVTTSPEVDAQGEMLKRKLAAMTPPVPPEGVL